MPRFQDKVASKGLRDCPTLPCSLLSPTSTLRTPSQVTPGQPQPPRLCPPHLGLQGAAELHPSQVALPALQVLDHDLPKAVPHVHLGERRRQKCSPFPPARIHGGKQGPAQTLGLPTSQNAQGIRDRHSLRAALTPHRLQEQPHGRGTGTQDSATAVPGLPAHLPLLLSALSSLLQLPSSDLQLGRCCP